MTVEEWVARWFSDPLRAAAARRMIWCFDDVPALPTPDGVRDVDGEPVDAGGGRVRHALAPRGMGRASS